MNDMDPVEFGRLQQSVEQLSRDLKELRAEHRDELRSLYEKVDALTALANKGRGAFWFAGLAWGSLGMFFSYVIHWINNR